MAIFFLYLKLKWRIHEISAGYCRENQVLLLRQFLVCSLEDKSELRTFLVIVPKIRALFLSHSGHRKLRKLWNVKVNDRST